MKRKPETVEQALEYLVSIDAVILPPRFKAWRELRAVGMGEWRTPKNALVFGLSPVAIETGRPVADGFVLLAVLQFVGARHYSLTTRTDGWKHEALVGFPFGTRPPVGYVGHGGTGEAETPGLAAAKALWEHLKALENIGNLKL